MLYIYKWLFYKETKTRPTLLPPSQLQLPISSGSVSALESSISDEELSSAELMLTPPSMKKSSEFSQKLYFTHTKQKQLHHFNNLTSPNSFWIVQQSLFSLSMNGEPAAPQKPPSRGDALWMNGTAEVVRSKALTVTCVSPEAHHCPAASQQSTYHTLRTVWTAFCSFEEYDHLHNHRFVDLCVSPCVHTCARDSVLRIYRGEGGECVTEREGEWEREAHVYAY